MCQTNLIPKTNTRPSRQPKHPYNLPPQPERQPLLLYQPTPPSPGSPNSSPSQYQPLTQHPKFSYFLADVNELIVKQAPQLRPLFLELLKQFDSL